jgi:hypothetical protein
MSLILASETQGSMHLVLRPLTIKSHRLRRDRPAIVDVRPVCNGTPDVNGRHHVDVDRPVGPSGWLPVGPGACRAESNELDWLHRECLPYQCAFGGLLNFWTGWDSWNIETYWGRTWRRPEVGMPPRPNFGEQ